MEAGSLDVKGMGPEGVQRSRSLHLQLRNHGSLLAGGILGLWSQGWFKMKQPHQSRKVSNGKYARGISLLEKLTLLEHSV